MRHFSIEVMPSGAIVCNCGNIVGGPEYFQRHLDAAKETAQPSETEYALAWSETREKQQAAEADVGHAQWNLTMQVQMLRLRVDAAREEGYAEGLRSAAFFIEGRIDSMSNEEVMALSRSRYIEGLTDAAAIVRSRLREVI